MEATAARVQKRSDAWLGDLREKKWIGFDLDDTLHDFRRSAGIATSQILEEISLRYEISVTALKEEYSRILRETNTNAFSDGKTSQDYRRERFTSLLARFSVPYNEEFMDELLESYETTLISSLTLKEGALDLLSTLKELGKKIVIITEGPQDAQERTVKALGIDEHTDSLATTNHFRVSKVDGLFSRVLEHLGISARDMAYIGDSEERDMKPAMAEGIFCVHFDETREAAWNSSPPRIHSLKDLLDLPLNTTSSQA
ncbi:hypothetical protein ONS95_005783 [Cadophora gregata]|uniref:uncharacterized protein n=1 Tax=Cadophora gregata TaxID=51156 RepID=UPI0026DD28E3|nr:uncharacterized protein ONS95_005783 [Cadophora gregata]KAK0103781.1 hypothetical protein ONS95_005783 [Cadophora gregata]KAK0107967.1 hypothetical protein ONS96_003750 [Cadophora gregata f. sp. sojae]